MPNRFLTKFFTILFCFVGFALQAQETVLTERTATKRIANWYLTDISAATLNRKIDELDARVIDLEVSDTAPMRFNASLVKNGGPYRGDWSWFFDMTADGLNARLDRMDARPIDIEIYRKAGEIRYAAVVKTNTGSLKTDWFWYHSQTPASLNEKFDRHKMRPIDIERYRDGNQTKYAAIMVDNRGAKKTDWFWYHSQSGADVLEKMKRHKMRILDLEHNGRGDSANHVIILVPYSHNKQFSWLYYGIKKADLTHMIRRHGARLIDAEQMGDKRYDVVLLENGISQRGHCGGKLKHLGEQMVKLMKFNAIPGGQISVTRNDRLVYSCSFGIADIGSLEKVTPDNLFRIMSVSKLLTISALEDLEAKGKIAKTDRMLAALGNRAPDFPYADPRMELIELDHLRKHMGGFINGDPDQPKFYDPMTNQTRASEDIGEGTPLSCRRLMEHAIKEFDLGYWPGIEPTTFTERQRYSNLGYCILQQVIAENSSSSYAKYVKKHILKPAGVTQMSIGQGRITKRKEGEVKYYNLPFAEKVKSVYPADTVKVPRPYSIVVEAMAGHGGWIASTNDLVRYGVFADGGSFEGSIVGTKSVLLEKGDTYIAINLNASPTNHSELDRLSFTGNTPVRTNPPKFSLTKFAGGLIDSVSDWPSRDLWSAYGYPQQ